MSFGDDDVHSLAYGNVKIHFFLFIHSFIHSNSSFCFEVCQQQQQQQHLMHDLVLY